jgi:endonuclease/exonuclease/phosphatase (EEP) superfamily protein YafD
MEGGGSFDDDSNPPQEQPRRTEPQSQEGGSRGGTETSSAENSPRRRVRVRRRASGQEVPQASAQQADGGNSGTWRMIKTLIATWKVQQTQAQELKAHRENFNGPLIICGDLNNGPYGYIYQQVATGLEDSFRKRGSGTGRTFTQMGYLPMRIDYVFANSRLRFTSHEVLHPATDISDHYPVLTRIRLDIHE